MSETWLPPWLLPWLPGIPWMRIWTYFIVFYVTYSLFTLWSYRFAIQSTGMREATFRQAAAARAVDIGLLIVAFLAPVSWLIKFPLLFLGQIIAFAVVFRAPLGRAIIGAMLTWLMGGLFTLIYLGLLVLYIWFFRSLPYGAPSGDGYVPGVA
ncbi:hypothetical protein [Chloracidobacterium aggregatum]|jgi:hypothetical protein|uniref:DUF4234 domain-containing protein n=1 Tax=Chloracidobacterium sp. N TaxID=2821540 RepID=A0ABX8AZ32_9BACT|nr:hypothetical protein [Chloracidobacterium aggregatum]QUV84147.1 hypothetical protein J8C03_08325 [Chloracidobacterium sp. 2]QUV87368.1 hypothetical protein J8C07_09315 [Chloracidobacterium sp. S]QUV90272.1 hypothetical protein J8C04_08320 [Chloracidobacterium sp. A]QUV93483.1 hypothetical protein J8C05_08900 [Chloracidobacterium sp. N]QUV96639.1 hypothetical protein J8C00_10045 [Chloracidobacterium sp. E]